MNDELEAAFQRYLRRVNREHRFFRAWLFVLFLIMTYVTTRDLFG
ncbi:MAG: hypothetical protein AAF368_00135 [Planctomycetota bacterium]